ncbi:TPA: hypothetical protein ACKPYB_000537 [Stenotrophomonas maltophilia]|uniref:hypothetical protein n=1 Tax=Stenotrophomonas TaxID=40323 RepID=UPI001AA0E8D8|nr:MULTISPECIES: hypothetical protein [Stenotrophomonas]ELF4107546.1 hypothetical protein [Stenotrophomonas maltophilia]MBO1745219.1 hypothetical protein [Stenotrophomonas maltophilia]WAP02806.1 hypothetical protein FQS62_004735 [Stenotrophomonas sp. SBJS02]HEA4093361.1 hypothetical protein [Stenotrophomonas maltophilia]HEA4097612.1 hypothetical protein [Stenotrophomonas maltophilia]
MATAGSIVIDLLMKTGSFETDTQRAERSMKRMKGTAQDAAKGVGTAFAAVGAAVGAGAGAAAAAVVNWTREVSELSQEVEKLSRLSGTDAVTFQKWAAGAASVGIQQDKLADILKDTQDKVGDFLQTGGGPMKDFFEKIAPKVGLTADQFRKLSGPQALGAYVEALQQAGLSQNEMTFYMEAIANDSTLLLPLLLDNAKGMRDWGDQATKFGAIIGDDTSKAMKEFREQANRVELMSRGMKIELAEGLTPALVDLNKELNNPEAQEGLASMVKLMGDMARGAAEATTWIVKLTGSYTGWLKGKGFMPSGADDPVASMQAERARLTEQLGSWRMNWFPDSTKSDVQKRIAEIDQMIKAAPFRGVSATVDSTARPGGSPPVTFDPNGNNGNKRTAAVKKERDALAELMADYDALYGSANDKASGLIAQLEREIALHGDASEAAKVSFDIQAGAYGALSDAQAEMLRNLAAVKDAQDDYAALYGDGLQKMADDTRAATDGMRTVTDQAVRNMQDAFAEFLFDPFKDGLGGMVEGFAKTLQKMAAQAAASQIFQMIGSWASGYSGAGASWVNAIGGAISGSAGGRAGGGPVAAGSMYRVGEGGRPELFDQGGKTYLIPGDAGSVRPITAGMPASSMGAGNGMSNNFNTTFNVTTDGSSNTQQGAGSDQARQVQQVFNQMINQWAVQQSRPGGLLHRMSMGG